MMNNTLGRKVFFVVCLLTFAGLLVCPSIIGAQQTTHKVEKGDTLWSICEKYYGDPDLWPKLWQMNPFITNPHFLNPGDIITLLEEEPVKKAETVEETAEAPKSPEPEMEGLDLAGYTKMAGLGFLSRQKIAPWGKLFFAEGSTLILAQGDKVFVDFGKRTGIEPLQEYTIYKTSDLIRHPLTDVKVGYLLSYSGRVAITGHVEKGIYEGNIVDAFKTINLGDPVIPYHPVAPCTKPLSAPEDLLATIVASKDQQELIGQYSVVYLNEGLNQGIRRGTVLEVVRIKKINDPDAETMTLGEFIKYINEKETLADISVSQLLKKFSKERPIYNIPLGKIIVLESRPDTSTAVVLSTKENFFVGAFARGITLPDPAEFLPGTPRCPLE